MSSSRRGVATRLAVVACLTILTNCVQDPLPSAEPRVVAEDEITLPPPPARALTVGVYNCIDTTGQRRPTGLAQELSTAVPMDCTPYLVEAIRSLRPGYVFLVERQHVDELLRERQLATLALNATTEGAGNSGTEAATGRSSSGETPRPPPRRLNTLRVAEILLVGQVSAYDRETRQATGGIAFGGLGGSGEVVTDVITFSLRAVAVQTGEILGQTSVTKSITSQKVGAHWTRILSTTVMDLEFGGAGNEPVGLALQAAVRSALVQLIDQGIKDGWWT